jgi:hypothetical protein
MLPAPTRAPLDPLGNVLTIVRWDDPAVDALGIDPRSLYAEQFWLGVLGPTAVWLLRRLADRFDDEPEGFVLDLAETASALGLGGVDSRHAPLRRAWARCVRYGAARPVGPDTLAVRRCLDLVPRRYLLRLPAAVRERHRAWESGPPTDDDGLRLRRRARLVALDLRELGIEPAAIERHLVRRGVHPAVAFEAAEWAWSPACDEDRALPAGAG